MSLKYFSINKLILKVDYKIFFINQFFCKIFQGKHIQENLKNISINYFMQNKWTLVCY
jgi:hypothetical protein